MRAEPARAGPRSGAGGRIYLTGFMASGKTAVGTALAESLGCRFVDLDREIEARAGASVREIFERLGEAAFRELEHEALEATARERALVVATGGGAMTFERNRALIRRLGTSVWLAPSFETILARLDERGIRERPLFGDPAQARALYEERIDAYRTADLKVEVDAADTAREVAARIRLLL